MKDSTRLTTESPEETVDRLWNFAKNRLAEWKKRNKFEMYQPSEHSFLTKEEQAEDHNAKMSLPSFGQLRVEAMARLAIKVAKRRGGLS